MIDATKGNRKVPFSLIGPILTGHLLLPAPKVKRSGRA
jgi:hypothetical protein